MGVNITTISYLRVLLIGIGSTIILKLLEAQGYHYLNNRHIYTYIYIIHIYIYIYIYANPQKKTLGGACPPPPKKKKQSLLRVPAFFFERKAKVRACFDCLSGADVGISRDAFRAPLDGFIYPSAPRPF